MTADELRSLADEASPGPWHIENPGIDGEDAIGGILLGDKDENGTYDDFIETDGGFYGPRLRNARLITLAPDLARLCAELGEALTSMTDMAAVSYEGDPWYAEEKNIDASTVFAQGKAALVKLSELKPVT